METLSNSNTNHTVGDICIVLNHAMGGWFDLVLCMAPRRV